MPADPDAVTSDACPFCRVEPSTNVVLHEGDAFYAMADYAPQAEAHVLIIPRRHYPHLAAMPQELDEEFLNLKKRFGDFVLREYGELTYWENGVFGQSVPHAHQHVMSISFDTSLFADDGPAFQTPAELRGLYESDPRHYFTVEHAGVSRYLPPDVEIQRRLLRYGRETMGGLRLLNSSQRREAAAPYLQTLVERWEAYCRRSETR